MKITPCRYCKREAIWNYPPREDAWYTISCKSGRGIIEYGPTVVEAIKSWNKRQKDK